MLSFEDALDRIFADVPTVGLERIAIHAADGRVLGSPVTADRPVPAFDQSTMDGYAISTADIAGEPPWEFPIAGVSRAGAVASTRTPKTAFRIFTGAPLPKGADAVVMQENVESHENRISFSKLAKSGDFVRKCGAELAAGAIAIEPGIRMHPGAIALSAMLGHAEVLVRRRPVVRILSTGDELCLLGHHKPGGIFESNGITIAALAQRAGADVTIAPIVNDEKEATTNAIRQSLAGADLLVTIGGVSVGDYDFVKPALEDLGVALDFWKVAIKPGKPLAFGRKGSSIVLGLPGNPASAMVTFALFGMPLLRAMQADRSPLPIRIPVRLADSRTKGDRKEFVRGAIESRDGELWAKAHSQQGSGAATSLALSDGLIVIPTGTGSIARGEHVELIRWNDC